MKLSASVLFALLLPALSAFAAQPVLVDEVRVYDIARPYEIFSARTYTVAGEPQVGEPSPGYGEQSFTGLAPVTLTAPDDVVVTGVLYRAVGWRLERAGSASKTGTALSVAISPDDLDGATFIWILEASDASKIRRVVATAAEKTGVWATAAVAGDAAAEVIQGELDLAGTDGLILVKPGVYQLKNQIELTKGKHDGTTIRSVDGAGNLARESTFLDGGYPARTNRLFYVNAPNVTLMGLTLQNAMLYRQNGGAICANKTGFAMTNCVIRDSIAQYGAGLYAAEDCHEIVDCVFKNNLASGFGSGYGFGAGAYFNKAATVRGCQFVGGEVTTEGGGCYCNGAYSFTDCTFTNNTTQTSGANQKGGAFYCNGTAGAFTNCQFLGNYAFENGSACFLNNNNATFETCRFVGNKGGGWGTIYTGRNGNQRIFNSYFSHNGGSSLSSIGVGGGSVVSNCVFENQTSTDGKGDRGVIGRSDGSGRINVTHCRFSNVYSSSFIDENTDINCCVFSNITMSFVFGRSTNKIRNSLFTGNVEPVRLADCTYENCSFVTNAAGPAVALINSGKSSPKLTNCVFWANSSYTGYYGTMGILVTKDDFDAVNRVKMANCVLQSNKETSSNAPDMRLADKTGETARLTALAIEKGPRFVDPKKGDWRLKRTSPLRDAGVKHDWMATATDLDCNPRCLDKRARARPDALPDIGCYEFAIRPGGLVVTILNQAVEPVGD